MKLKCIVNCNGQGYEDFKIGEEREIKKDVAEKLITFEYAEPVDASKPDEKPDEKPKK